MPEPQPDEGDQDGLNVLYYATPTPARPGRQLRQLALVCDVLFCLIPFAGCFIGVFDKPRGQASGFRAYIIGNDLAVVIPGIALALAAGTLRTTGHVRSKGKPYSFSSAPAWPLTIVGLQCLLLTLCLPARSQNREAAYNRPGCIANLRQIDAAITLYANDHNGQLPQQFEQLITSYSVIPRTLICPSSSDVTATGSTTDALLAQFNNDGHCSYVYLGTGLKRSRPPKFILVYERFANHEQEGIHVLYGDGTVRWLAKQEARHVLAELAANHNPPRRMGTFLRATAPSHILSPATQPR